MRLPVCNGRPDRAPRVFGMTFPLCWRCTAAIAAMLVVARALEGLDRAALALMLPLALPAAWDGVRQYGLGIESTNRRRIWTGFGLGVATIAGAAIVKGIVLGL